jgi:glycopeptide antibiotics resistance protein
VKVWKLWIVVVALVSGPWYGLLKHPQWNRVTWIPFHGAEDKPRDMAVNFVLWLPFGWSFVDDRPSLKRVAKACAVALAVSCSVESAQLYFRLRDPSATDVFMALCGTATSALACAAIRS